MIRFMTTHGDCRSKLNKVWRNMKDRCYNPNNKRYPHYGARGITVCEEWKNSYVAFKAWAIANGYKAGLSIDRVNNDGIYEPSNCKWSNSFEQNNNFSRNHFITYQGITKSICEWARMVNIHHNTLDYRIKKGWDIGKALNYPDIVHCGDDWSLK